MICTNKLINVIRFAVVLYFRSSEEGRALGSMKKIIIPGWHDKKQLRNIYPKEGMVECLCVRGRVHFKDGEI